MRFRMAANPPARVAQLSDVLPAHDVHERTYRARVVVRKPVISINKARANETRTGDALLVHQRPRGAEDGSVAVVERDDGERLAQLALARDDVERAVEIDNLVTTAHILDLLFEHIGRDSHAVATQVRDAVKREDTKRMFAEHCAREIAKWTH